MKTGKKVFALWKKGIASIAYNDFKPVIQEGEIHKVNVPHKHLAFFPYNSKGQMTGTNLPVGNYTFHETRDEAYAAAKQQLLDAIESQRQKVEQYFIKHPKA